MPILITGLFAPSGGAGSFDLYAPEDIQAGDVNVILQAIAGGSFKGGSHATSPAGEIVAQVKTTTGAPSHSATLGTLCWNSIDLILYLNNNGTTGWTAIGTGGGAPADADYLVGTAQAGLSAEIVVGTAPGGELGGTWASPTVDATHSGSAHHAAITLAADADALLGLSGQELQLDSQNPNLVLAGPASAPAADPAFRALVDADIPAAIARDSEVTTAVSDHAGAGDPHTPYQKESEKDAASGYAGLTAGTKLNLAQMQEVMAYADLTDDPYADHSARHENAGADEISVAGLSGELADAQPPKTHASSHQNTGSDEVATATPAANAIPKAGAGGKLAAGWLQEVLAYADLTDDPAVLKTLFDAQTIIAAVSDNTPVAVTVAEQTVVGRKTGGNIDDIALNAASGICQLDANGRVDPTQTAEESFSITIETPTASEDIGLQRFNVPITITKIVGVLTGDYTSVTINPKFSTDRSAAGTAVLSSATAITSTTTGTVITSFGDATIPADSFLWLETTAKTGTAGNLELTVFFTKD